MAKSAVKKGVLERISGGAAAFMQKFLPDAFLFAVVLTVIVFLGGMVATGQGPIAMLTHWGKGVWGLLAFSMQMVLVLVTGHVLALAPPFKKLLVRLAAIPKTPFQGIALVTIVSYIACILNWGFGLVIGAIYAKEIAKKLRGIDYRLLIASAYCGFVWWHAGFSGSIPLSISTQPAPGTAIANTGGVMTQAAAFTETLFSPTNIFIVVVSFLVLPVVTMLMHPRNEEDVVSIDPSLLKEEETPKVTKEQLAAMSPAEKLENLPIINLALGAMGVVYIILYFSGLASFNLDLNIVNFIFLTAGVLLHWTPRSLLNAVGEAAKGAGGIVLQFPLYAGIQAMMVGANAVTGASLASVISNFFVNISVATGNPEKTFPFFTFLSAGIVNFFVPSGGGQWAVQGPVMLPAAQALGNVSLPQTAMAIAYGDSWTNMIQPFWALPALGIAKLGARDIMGYSLIVLIVTGVIASAGLLIFS